MDLHAKITGKKEVMAIKIDREDDAERFVDGKDPSAGVTLAGEL